MMQKVNWHGKAGMVAVHFYFTMCQTQNAFHHASKITWAYKNYMPTKLHNNLIIRLSHMMVGREFRCFFCCAVGRIIVSLGEVNSQNQGGHVTVKIREKHWGRGGVKLPYLPSSTSTSSADTKGPRTISSTFPSSLTHVPVSLYKSPNPGINFPCVGGGVGGWGRSWKTPETITAFHWRDVGSRPMSVPFACCTNKHQACGKAFMHCWLHWSERWLSLAVLYAAFKLTWSWPKLVSLIELNSIIALATVSELLPETFCIWLLPWIMLKHTEVLLPECTFLPSYSLMLIANGLQYVWQSLKPH